MIRRLCVWCGKLFEAPEYAVTLCPECFYLARPSDVQLPLLNE